MTWLGKLCVVKKLGDYTPTELIKQWNSSCTNASQLKGSKYTALLNLLSLPEQAVEVLLAHLSEFGSSGIAFPETIWATKRIMPGGGPKGYPKEWNSRLTMTNAGFLLLLKYVISQHKQKLEGSRTKILPGAMEEAASMCQLLTSVTEELQRDVPVQHKVVEGELIQEFLQGSMNLELELQNALSVRAAGFKAGDLPTIRQVITKHVADAEEKLSKMGMASQAIEPTKLEDQEFQLAMAAIKHDLDLYAVWLTRTRDRDAAAYHQSLQWRLSRQNRAKEVAESHLSRSSEHGKIWFSHLDSAQDARKFVQDVMKQIIKQEQIPSEQLVILVVLNWAAPNLWTSQCQKDQAALMGSLLNMSGSPRSMGLFLQPTFCYEKGKLVKVEEGCFKLLTSMNLNLDTIAVLPYKGRCDDRSKRPEILHVKCSRDIRNKMHSNRRNQKAGHWCMQPGCASPWMRMCPRWPVSISVAVPSCGSR